MLPLVGEIEIRIISQMRLQVTSQMPVHSLEASRLSCLSLLAQVMPAMSVWRRELDMWADTYHKIVATIGSLKSLPFVFAHVVGEEGARLPKVLGLIRACWRQIQI